MACVCTICALVGRQPTIVDYWHAQTGSQHSSYENALCFSPFHPTQCSIRSRTGCSLVPHPTGVNCVGLKIGLSCLQWSHKRNSTHMESILFFSSSLTAPQVESGDWGAGGNCTPSAK